MSRSSGLIVTRYDRKFSLATIGPRTVRRTDRLLSTVNRAVRPSSVTAVLVELFDDPPPSSARPIAITAAIATIIMTITSRIGMNRDKEFLEYFMGSLYHIFPIFALNRQHL